MVQVAQLNMKYAMFDAAKYVPHTALTAFESWQPSFMPQLTRR